MSSLAHIGPAQGSSGSTLEVRAIIQVHDLRIEITLDPARILSLLNGATRGPAVASAEDAAPIILNVEAQLKRTGIGKRMVLANGSEAASADPSLLRLMARAFAVRDRLIEDTSLTLKEIAKEEDVVNSYVTRLLRLSFLAPDIVAAILNGDQPAGLTASRLARWKTLPFDWAEQRRILDFPDRLRLP